MPNSGLVHLIFEKTLFGWVRRDVNSGRAPPVGTERLTLSIKQDLNTPPDYYITDDKTGREFRLTHLNTQLQELQLPQAQAFQWTAQDGKIWKGGLLLPPSYDRSKRHPLVVQIHCFEEINSSGIRTRHWKLRLLPAGRLPAQALSSFSFRHCPTTGLSTPILTTRRDIVLFWKASGPQLQN